MKCYFCGKEIPKDKGILYAKADGTHFYFCSSKCYRNAIVLKRDPRKLKWTKKYQKRKKKK